VSENPATTTTTKVSTTLLLKKKLLLATKQKKLLAEKQERTLDALKLSTRALKVVKLKLVKYQKAYLILKKRSQAAPVVDTSKVASLEAELARLEADLAKANERMSKTLGLLKESKTETKDARSRLREVERAVREGAGDSAALEVKDNQIAALRAEVGKLKQQLTEAASSRQAEESLASLEAELEATRQEVLALQDEGRATAEEIADRDTEIAELQNQISELGGRLAELSLGAGDAQAANTAATENLRSQLESAKKSLAKEVAASTAFMAELESANAETAKLSKDLSKTKEALSKAELTRQQQQEKLTQLAEAFAQLQDAHSRSRFTGGEDLEDALSQVAELQGTLLEESARNTELELAAEQAEKRLAAREKEHEEVLLKLWDLEERIKSQGGDLEGALGAKEAEIAEMKKARAALEESLATAETEREKALARLNESRDEASRLEAEHREKTAEFEQNRSRITELEMKVLTLSQKADEDVAKVAAATSAQENLAEELAALKARNTELETRVGAANDEDPNREPAEARAAKAEARLKNVEEQLVDTRSRLLSSHNEMDEIDQARLSAVAKLAAVEKDLEFRSSQIQQLENLVALLEQKEDTFNRQLQALRRQVTELFEENSGLKEELQTKTSRLLTVERSYEETDEKFTNLKRRYEITTEAFEKAKDELTEARTRALQSMGRTDEAEKNYAKAERTVRAAAEEIKHLKRKIERLVEHVAELEA
jgi:chromosome segregation ATPase